MLPRMRHDSPAHAVLNGPPLAPGPEFDLIRRFLPRHPAERPDVPVGPGDDCAVVLAQGVALSCDLSVEGVHFRRDWLSLTEIGARATAAALSDLAAVAARPIGVLVSLALPARDAGEHAVRLMEGVRRAAHAADAMVLGGDVASSPQGLVIDVTVVGEAAHPVLRSGARAADEVWVTGELGASALCVQQLLAGTTPDPAARERFAAPHPRLREARWLQERGFPSAMIDLSDGLGGDAAHLAAASGAAILLVPELIPLHPAVVRHAASPEEALALALSGGEDYELCFTAAPGVMEAHAAEFEAAFNLRLSCVGRVAGGDGVWFTDAEGRRSALPGVSFQHFR
jgi:thiamine-monophosphate kinase